MQCLVRSIRHNAAASALSFQNQRVASMWITTDQAIDIYARYCKARFGARATKLARDRMAELRQSGDLEGERIWEEVSRRVDQQPARQVPALSS
jgi:hypothetical protein